MGDGKRNFARATTHTKCRDQALSSGKNREYEKAARDNAKEFSPDELAQMVERWREQHMSELLYCLQPGVSWITQKQCDNYRGNAVHTNSDDVSVCFLFVCRECPNNNKSHKKIKQYNEVCRDRQRAMVETSKVNATLNGQLTIKEVAARLGLDRNLIYKHMMDGKLKAERIKHGHKGRVAWGIYPEDLEEYREWLATTK